MYLGSLGGNQLQKKSWIQELNDVTSSLSLSLLCHAGVYLASFSDKLSHHILGKLLSSNPRQTYFMFIDYFGKNFP